MEILSSTRTLLTIVATALISACSPSNDYTPDRTPRMNKPSPRIDKLFAQTKPVCFGRFLIDVPVTAQVVWGPTDAPDTIVSYANQGYKIPAQIKDKTEEIEKIKHLKEPSTLIGVFDGPNPDSKIVVGYESRHSAGLIQLHSYIRLGKHAFVQSAPSVALGELPGGGDDKASYVKPLAELQNVARRLRVREASEIPAESGLCIENGFVADGEDFKAELTSIGFRFPEYPDVSFSVMTIKADRVNPDDSLEVALEGGRQDAVEAGMGAWYHGIKSLREGQRAMGDWSGYEKLARLPAHKPGSPSVHEFVFKSIGVAKDRYRPYVNMQLDTGVDGDSTVGFEPSLKDDETVALWDRLTTTIRARPTGGAATGAGEPKPNNPAPGPQSRTPLGTSLTSGTRCPQSGFWQCATAHAVGGDRRFVTAGEVLPRVLVRVERSLFQKLKGAPQNELAETAWTLVAYPDADKQA